MSRFTRRTTIIAGTVILAAPRLALAHQVTLPDHLNPTAVQTGRPDRLPGEIHVLPDEFHLFLMAKDGAAIRYGVGVGRKGLYESGVFTIARKAKWPWWRPTQAMIRRDPGKYAKYKNGMKGGLNNPLGARALYLYDDQGSDTYLRIHGTNAPSTIGSAVSNGCARLTNEHIKDLYDRVVIGTRVTLHPKVTTA